MRNIFFGLAFLLFTNYAFAQVKPANDTSKVSKKKYRATVVNGDTIPIVYLGTYYAIDNRTFKNKRKEKKYYNLIAKVKKVLPIARGAGKLYKILNNQLLSATEADKLSMMRRVEKDIKKKYTKTIENLSYTEGMILLKLIDRETGNSAYHLVQELRGDIKAWFWQGIGHLFDVNLKQEYDPTNDDKDIEDIVFLIDKGMV
jgi:hypothetical protein